MLLIVGRFAHFANTLMYSVQIFHLAMPWTSHADCCRMSYFPSTWSLACHLPPAFHQPTACSGSFQIENLVYKTANEDTSPSVQAMVHPGPAYQLVNASSSANVTCLAVLMWWPGNHSSQPWLSYLMAWKNIVMISAAQHGPKSKPIDAET